MKGQYVPWYPKEIREKILKSSERELKWRKTPHKFVKYYYKDLLGRKKEYFWCKKCGLGKQAKCHRLYRKKRMRRFY